MRVQGVFLKTSASVALPLFQCLPDAKLRIDTKPAPASAPTPVLEEAAPVPKAALKAAPKAAAARKTAAPAQRPASGKPKAKKARL